MTIKCRPFYSMQKIIQNGNVQDFHRKFGARTEGRHGVYIWGFAKETPNLSEESKGQLGIHWPSDPMNEFAVDVESKNIGIYYVGKVESKNLNVFERIMQERANLFGGFSPIFNWDHYFEDTPFLSVWQQLNDALARDEKHSSKAHRLRLEKYEKCTCGQTKPFPQLNPILHSNSSFHENNLFERLITPKNERDFKLQESLSNISKKFIFTWVEMENSTNTEKVENLLHELLGVNILGIGGKKRIGAINKGDFKSNQISKGGLTIDFNCNQELYNRIVQINDDSIRLQNNCKCFKG